MELRMLIDIVDVEYYLMFVFGCFYLIDGDKC